LEAVNDLLGRVGERVVLGRVVLVVLGRVVLGRPVLGRAMRGRLGVATPG
jgi:hypothetical protein